VRPLPDLCGTRSQLLGEIQSVAPISERPEKAEEQMRCPFCGTDDTQVKDSRPTDDRGAIRRRRFCPNCTARFTTFERVQLRELTVIKKNGQREPFDRDKLARSIYVALRKRPFEPDRVERIINSLVRQLESSGETEIPSGMIGGLAEPRPGGLHPFRLGLPQLPRGKGFWGFCRADSGGWRLTPGRIGRVLQRNSASISV
jgi:transcriptional repressor NrdR